MKKILFMGLLSSLLGLLGCGKTQDQPSLSEWTNDPRKVRTEVELTELGIPINRWLPLIEVEDEVRIRDAKEVAKRVVVLCAIASIGLGDNRDTTRKFIEEE